MLVFSENDNPSEEATREGLELLETLGYSINKKLYLFLVVVESKLADVKIELSRLKTFDGKFKVGAAVGK